MQRSEKKIAFAGPWITQKEIDYVTDATWTPTVTYAKPHRDGSAAPWHLASKTRTWPEPPDAKRASSFESRLSIRPAGARSSAASPRATPTPSSRIQ